MMAGWFAEHDHGAGFWTGHSAFILAIDENHISKFNLDQCGVSVRLFVADIDDP